MCARARRLANTELHIRYSSVMASNEFLAYGTSAALNQQCNTLRFSISIFDFDTAFRVSNFCFLFEKNVAKNVLFVSICGVFVA